MKKELREIPIFVTSIPEYMAFLFENNIDNTPKVYQVYTLARLQLRKDVYNLEEKLKEAESLLVESSVCESLFKLKIKELEKELEQQRFNNKHNLSIDQAVADKIEQLEKELELRSSWVKHHQKCVEASSVREHKLEERLAHLEKVCENSMDSEHEYANYRKVFKV